jgi:hypothetical protein
LNKALFVLNTLRYVTDESTLLRVFHGYFMPHIYYSVIFWGSTGHCDTVFKLQKKAIRFISGLGRRDSCRPLFIKFKLLTVPAVYIHELLSFMRRSPARFEELRPQHSYGTRNQLLLGYPAHRLTVYERGPFYMALRIYNSLPGSIKSQFKDKNFLNVLKNHLIKLCPYSLNEALIDWRKCDT